MKIQNGILIYDDFAVRVSSIDYVSKEPQDLNLLFKVKYSLHGSDARYFLSCRNREEQDLCYEQILNAMINNNE